MVLRLLSLYIISCCAFGAIGQTVNVRKEGFSKPSHLIPSAYPKDSVNVIVSPKAIDYRDPAADRYILDNKKLSALFKSAKIPGDFPLYNKSIGYEENKEIALLWLLDHKPLLTKDFRNRLKKKAQKKEIL